MPGIAKTDLDWIWSNLNCDEVMDLSMILTELSLTQLFFAAERLARM